MNYGDIYKNKPSQSRGTMTPQETSKVQPLKIGDIPISTKGIGKVVDWLNSFENDESVTTTNTKEKKDEKKKNSKTAEQLLPLINRLRRIGINNEEVLTRLQRTSDTNITRSASTPAHNRTYNQRNKNSPSAEQNSPPRTSRIDELAKPKKLHYYPIQSKSPIWKVTRSALSVEPSTRIKELAEPKFRHPEPKPEFMFPPRETPPPNYHCSSRTLALAKPKYVSSSTLDALLPVPVKSSALRTVASEHIEMLAKPKVPISAQTFLRNERKKKAVQRKKKALENLGM